MAPPAPPPDTAAAAAPAEPAEAPAAVPGGRPAASMAESQLALAVELGNIAVWRHDLTSNRMYYNDRAFAVLGIPGRPEGLSLEEVRGYIHPEDLPAVVASAREALARDEPTDMQARYRRSDGSWRQVMTRRTVQRAADGTPIAFVGVALDVTSSNEQRERVEQMQRRFEVATAAAGIGYWVLTANDERARWSDALRQIVGLPAGEPVPTTRDWLEHHVHPEDRDRVQAQLRQWLAHGADVLRLDFRVRRPDGRECHLETHSLIERVGGEPLQFGVIIDRTERRLVDLALRSATERVALAARGAGLGTWEVDLASGNAFWDDAMWRLRGREPEARAMSAEERLAVTHPDDRERAGRLWDKAMRDGLPYENEFRVVWPDGSVHWLASRSVEIRDEASGARRRIGVNWDITDKRTNEAVRQERELARRESQAKSQFLARMSHELRTPLNAVLGFSQLLLDDEAGDDAASALRRQRLAYVRSAGEHLLTLINDVLDLSSLESGEVRVAREPVALAQLVAEALPLLGPLLGPQPPGGSRHPQVSVHTGALAGEVLADPLRLRQALLNLLSNAIKYNREGGQVHIDAAPAPERPGRILLRVADTGHGFDDEQRRQLFEPFNRLGRERPGAGAVVPGTGIGLAIVKALVERMGGQVHLTSAPGEGSTFAIELDAVAATEGVTAGTPAPTAAPQGTAAAGAPVDTGLGTAAGAQPGAADGAAAARKLILYVEDNPVNALIIGELLARRRDIELVIAPDGASGVRMAGERTPDLVLLDMQLPDFDGFEVLRRLRGMPATAGVRCIALSANAMPEDIERALAAGMSEYWTKPLDFKAFLASLDALFGRPEP